MTNGKYVLACLSALAVLSLGALVGLLAEAGPRAQLEHLGFAGPAVYVAAVRAEGVVPNDLPDRVEQFAAANGVSVAFTPGSSGMVTVLDPALRIATPQGPVTDLLAHVVSTSEDGQASADAPSGLLSASARGLDEVLSADGSSVPFERVAFGSVTFADDRLTTVVNTAAQPFGDGYYLFLGTSQPAPIVTMFAAAGMDVLQVDQPATLGGYLRSPFGVVAVGAVLACCVTAAITAGICATSARPRLQVMAMIGAPRRVLASEVVHRLLPPIVWGGAAGAALMVVAAVLFSDAALSSAGAQVRTVTWTLGLLGFMWAAAVALVTWLQVKWCRDAQPC